MTNILSSLLSRKKPDTITWDEYHDLTSDLLDQVTDKKITMEEYYKKKNELSAKIEKPNMLLSFLKPLKGFLIPWLVFCVCLMGGTQYFEHTYCPANAPWNAQHWAQQYYPNTHVAFHQRGSSAYLLDVYGTPAPVPFTINCDCNPGGSCRVYNAWRIGE